MLNNSSVYILFSFSFVRFLIPTLIETAVSFQELVFLVLLVYATRFVSSIGWWRPQLAEEPNQLRFNYNNGAVSIASLSFADDLSTRRCAVLRLTSVSPFRSLFSSIVFLFQCSSVYSVHVDHRHVSLCRLKSVGRDSPTTFGRFYHLPHPPLISGDDWVRNDVISMLSSPIG